MVLIRNEFHKTFVFHIFKFFYRPKKQQKPAWKQVDFFMNSFDIFRQ